MGKRSRWGFIAAAVIAAATLAAYSNSLSGPFVLDDAPSIVGNPTIRSLGTALSPPTGGLTVSGRPILNLSLAIDDAFFGTRPRGYHLTNLAIHLAAALVLFGLVKRIAARTPLPAEALAFGVALVWALHPLQTAAVTYVIQRAESLMGLFYLLTLYCYARSAEGTSRAKAWAVASVVACALGMGTKEVMVSAPVVAFLFDATFLAGSFRESWQKRRALLGALAATWIPLCCLVASTHGRGGTSGFGVMLSPERYWWSQARAVFHYLRLVVWPRPLVFDYGLMPAWIGHPAAALPAAIGVMALMVAVVIGLSRRTAAGFLGFVFLAILAPSSLVPGARQVLAEHRMYLALAPLLILSLAGVCALLQKIGSETASAGLVVFCGCAGMAFGAVTFLRNGDYRSELVLWSNTVADAPDNPFARTALGTALLDSGRVAEAQTEFREALRLYPDYPDAHDNLGTALLQSGDASGAIAELSEAERLNPKDPLIHHNLGSAQATQGETAAAIAEFKEAVRLNPNLAEAHNSLGILFDQSGRIPEALEEFGRVVVLQPKSAEARNNQGNALRQLGRVADARRAYEDALRMDPTNEDARANLSTLAP